MNRNSVFSGWKRAMAVLAGACLLPAAFASAALDAAALAAPAAQQATAAKPAKTAAKPRVSALAGIPCNNVVSAPLATVTVGKSQRLKTPFPVSRIVLGSAENSQAGQPKAPAADANKAAAPQQPDSGKGNGVAAVDVVLLGPNEIYLMGKSVGATNVILASRSGQCALLDIAVSADTATLQSTLTQLLSPEGGGRIKVSAAADSLVLSGAVPDAGRLEKAVLLASAYVGKDKVINMLSVDSPQQVMLEVKVAEVSKKLLDKLGVQLAGSLNKSGWTFSWLSNFLAGNTSLSLGASNNSPINSRSAAVDGEHDDGLVKVLAEPTVMAISGQEGSFLAGGKIFIPVAQNISGGAQTITLEEKEFGVALHFTPTVLEGGLINLKVAPEVSELNPEGIGLTVPGQSVTTIFPSFTTRRAATTVQLHDGQSFAIGGLIKNNVTTNVSAFPFLGEIPVLGALFRSTRFQTDKSELVFVVTPRLVKPLPENYALPTDNYIPPSRADLILNGRMEGKPPEPPKSAGTVTGFELK